MAVELITGHSGTAHIDSADVQALLAGTVSEEGGALATAQGLKLTVSSANKVVLGTGDAIIPGGAHVRVTSPEALTVQSGGQGVKRNDLVVLQYTKDSAGVESATAAVVKGTPTSGTPADPSVPKGKAGESSTAALPLYRLPIDGVKMGDPVRLVAEVPSLASLRDSVSPHVLYDDASRPFKEGATLSDDPSRYSRLTVMCQTNDGDFFSVEVPHPRDGVRFVASCLRWAPGDYVWAKTKLFQVTGSTIGTANVDGTWCTGSYCLNDGRHEMSDGVKPVQVVGWR